MKTSLLFFLFFAGFWILTSGCSRNTAPPASTMHTEPIHHKWQVIELNGSRNNLPYTFLDLRDVHHSQAALGCDTFSITPRFGFQHRLQLSGGQSKWPLSTCTNHPLKNPFLVALANASHFGISAGTLILKNPTGNTLLKAVLDSTDEKGSIRRKWLLTFLIHTPVDSLVQYHAYIDLTQPVNNEAYLGCNQIQFAGSLSGSYEIQFSQMTSTRMICKGQKDAETVFSKALPLVKKYQVIGNRLKLFDKDDVLLLEGISALK